MDNRRNNDINHKENPGFDPDTVLSLKSVRYFLVAAGSLSIFSLFLPGGLYLSIAGLICSITALFKLRGILSSEHKAVSSVKQIRTIAIVCIVICSLIFLLNVISIFVVYPMLIEMIENGTFEEAGINTEYMQELLGSSPGEKSNW